MSVSGGDRASSNGFREFGDGVFRGRPALHVLNETRPKIDRFVQRREEDIVVAVF